MKQKFIDAIRQCCENDKQRVAIFTALHMVWENQKPFAARAGTFGLDGLREIMSEE